MEASAEQNDFDDDVVANCIVEQAKDWTFPAPLGGGLVLVKYPFLFESNN